MCAGRNDMRTHAQHTIYRRTDLRIRGSRLARTAPEAPPSPIRPRAAPRPYCRSGRYCCRCRCCSCLLACLLGAGCPQGGGGSSRGCPVLIADDEGWPCSIDRPQRPLMRLRRQASCLYRSVDDCEWGWSISASARSWMARMRQDAATKRE